MGAEKNHTSTCQCFSDCGSLFAYKKKNCKHMAIVFD